MKDNNSILTIQEMLMREMKRLDDNELMKKDGANEIARSNALSNQATTYLKSVNLSIKIMEVADKNQQTRETVQKELGL